MPRKTMVEAIRDAIDVKMGEDDNVVVFGEDVGYFGGVFRATQGLQAKYGKSRCFDTPINELGIVGVAVGMAAYGLRPHGGSRPCRAAPRNGRPAPRRARASTRA